METGIAKVINPRAQKGQRSYIFQLNELGSDTLYGRLSIKWVDIS